MKSVDEASKFIGRMIGAKSRDLFDLHMDDALYYAKALSFSSIADDTSAMEDHFHLLVERALTESANLYLQQNHSSEEGLLEINIAYDCVYDKNMSVIKPVKRLLDRRKEIVRASLKHVMATFQRGRKLAQKIAARHNNYARLQNLKKYTRPSPKDQNWEPLACIPKRDYSKRPAEEMLEVEIMRLERKLPNLSTEEGYRLSSLYKQLQPIAP